MNYINNDLAFDDWIKQHKNKFIIDPKTGCWLWIASLSGSGYGRVSYGNGNKMKAAHVVFYEKKTGISLGTLYGHHICKTRRCVNPDHIEPKGHATNCSIDFRKLSIEQEAELIAMWKSTTKFSLRSLGRRFGIDKATVKQVIRKNK